MHCGGQHRAGASPTPFPGNDTAVPSVPWSTEGVAGPRQLRGLLDAVLVVGSGLDLATTLRHITEAAVQISGANYGALGVLDDERTMLAEFITIGIDDELRKEIGDLPKGHGILGSLIAAPRPLRLPDLREHPDSYGFPPNHPPMTIVPRRADRRSGPGLRQPLPVRQGGW